MWDSFWLLWFLLGIKLIQNAVELHTVTMMEKNTNDFAGDVFSRDKKKRKWNKNSH